jgi:hypothetical protein
MFNQSGLFFVPRTWQSHGFVRWLKRIHAWSGFWGALFFLGMGVSGFFLNHRAQLKIDTGEPIEVSAVHLPVSPGAIPNAEGLGDWAKKALDLPVKGQAPRGGAGEGPGAGGKRGETRFMGREVTPVETWTRAFNMAHARVTVTYVKGANHVTAKREEHGFLSTLKNLHKGTGLPVAWVLLIDTIAGALITMSLTGFLLWSRMHGSRLLAGGLVGGSLIWAFVAAGSSMG